MLIVDFFGFFSRGINTYKILNGFKPETHFFYKMKSTIFTVRVIKTTNFVV